MRLLVPSNINITGFPYESFPDAAKALQNYLKGIQAKKKTSKIILKCGGERERGEAFLGEADGYRQHPFWCFSNHVKARNICRQCRK